jgi:hypothetical protein
MIRVVWDVMLLGPEDSQETSVFSNRHGVIARRTESYRVCRYEDINRVWMGVTSVWFHSHFSPLHAIGRRANVSQQCTAEVCYARFPGRSVGRLSPLSLLVS